MRTRLGAAVRIAAAAALAATLVGPASPADAAVEVKGAGSTWSAIAIDQWRADVARQGITINYQHTGSTAGRSQYYNDQVDFAVSEIPFQRAYDTDGSGTITNEIDRAAHRPYAYLPIVAGGTSFMYQLKVNGQLVRDLKLSPVTVTKIFTGGITNWNHAEIAADNPGRQLPDLAIIPVIRSDGSGTSAQFTAWMATEPTTKAIWDGFCGCGSTSVYPPFGNARAYQGSDGVANQVAAGYNNGAITYVEYGYAKARNFPVASVLNKAGYFTQPTAQNVAIALQAARLNPDRTQVLDGVYANPDPRTYPVSSYSYMIAPTSTAKPFTAEKGEPLGKFILYFLCAGQQKAEQLGYSPLPKNLVEFGFEAVRDIPGAPTPPPIDQCANPTITGGFTSNLSKAPLPPPSAKKGATPTTAPASAGGTTSSPTGTARQSTTGSPAATTGTGSGARVAGTQTTRPSGTRTTPRRSSVRGATASSGAGSEVAAGDPLATGDVYVDETGAVVDETGAVVEGSDGQVALGAVPVSVGDDTGTMPFVPYLLVAFVFLAIVFLPPALVIAGQRPPSAPPRP